MSERVVQELYDIIQVYMGQRKHDEEPVVVKLRFRRTPVPATTTNGPPLTVIPGTFRT
ncbi:uncharacterized protein BDW43DRAFT_308298 [Aspergillus alliaceus]|uniref:uncharacterized protein n=1 Tax=Petromyces alliaceus TaxID=209559 RepID=UPI0012A3DF2B|nr:uncharacterized protein BDW43DRAFT_308298 [Aspergillus alliaceus]KAB8236621.1 hypothetical protein BDW43DRAFT_308298 [Aspergillus alliaceus]